MNEKENYRFWCCVKINQCFVSYLSGVAGTESHAEHGFRVVFESGRQKGDTTVRRDKKKLWNRNWQIDDEAGRGWRSLGEISEVKRCRSKMTSWREGFSQKNLLHIWKGFLRDFIKKIVVIISLREKLTYRMYPSSLLKYFIWRNICNSLVGSSN